jgi:hypothetical protein
MYVSKLHYMMLLHSHFTWLTSYEKWQFMRWSRIAERPCPGIAARYPRCIQVYLRKCVVDQYDVRWEGLEQCFSTASPQTSAGLERIFTNLETF